MHLLPLTLLLALLPPSLTATPSPPLLSSASDISLMPHHILFLRQLQDLQTFDGALGGSRASPITNSGDPQRPFQVEGDTFDQFQSAAQRSCDVQFKGCSDAANGVQAQGNGNGNGNGNRNGGGNGNDNGNGGRDERKSKGKKGKMKVKRQNGGITVNQCDEQKNQCNAAQSAATVKDFTSAVPSTNIGPDPQFPDFDLICEG